MGKEQLKEFFREKVRKSDSAGMDWNARKKEYQKSLRELYRAVEDCIDAEKGTKEHLFKISFREKIIEEPYLGVYKAKELVLEVGDEKVVFSPRGRYIVGAAGRVDLIGEMGAKTLVVQPDGGWGIIASRTPTPNVVPLDADSLLAALKEVMRK